MKNIDAEVKFLAIFSFRTRAPLALDLSEFIGWEEPYPNAARIAELERCTFFTENHNKNS
jgi:hypothetical protein